MFYFEKKRFSKLHKRIKTLFVNDISLQFHMTVYRQHSPGWGYGSNAYPRYWLQLGQEIIWDYPHDFMRIFEEQGHPRTLFYPDWGAEYNVLHLICQYLNTPRDQLWKATEKDDRWSLYEVLKAADRRIGKQRLLELHGQCAHPAVDKIIEARLKKDGGHHGKV